MEVAVSTAGESHPKSIPVFPAPKSKRTNTMKNIITLLIATSAAIIGLLLSSCASMDSSNQQSMLSAAGFVSRTPENANQRKLYDELTPYKVHRATYKGKVIYAYKNEKEGVAYVGNEAAYQRYQQIAIQKRIASDYYQAAEMNRAAAYGWYGYYGPYVYRHGYYIR